MSEAKKAKKPIVIVTGNKNKLAEFKQILGDDFPYEVRFCFLIKKQFKESAF